MGFVAAFLSFFGSGKRGGQAAAVRHGAGRGDGRAGELMEVEVDEV